MTVGSSRRDQKSAPSTVGYKASLSPRYDQISALMMRALVTSPATCRIPHHLARYRKPVVRDGHVPERGQFYQAAHLVLVVDKPHAISRKSSSIV
jgi:hypothetical protein